MGLYVPDYAQMSRERALNTRLDGVETQLATAQSQLLSTQASIPGIPTIGNRVRNGEFDFNDLVYITATYGAASADRPFGWYAQDSTLNTVITETVAATESARSIKLLKTATDGVISLGTPNTLTSATAAFVAGDVGSNVWIKGAGVAGADLLTTISAFTSATVVSITTAASTAVTAAFVAVYTNNTGWHKGQGNVWLGGIDALYAPIPKTLFYPGKNVFMVGKVKLNGDMNRTALDPTWKLRIAIYDNTAGQQKIIEGAPFALKGSVISGAGAKTRQYILVVNTPTAVYYLSDITTPLSIGSLPAPVPSGSAGSVLISWIAFTDAESYELYRSDTDGGLTNYYKLITIQNGDTTFIDQGGRNGSPFAFTTQVNPKAQAFLENFGKELTSSSWEFFRRTITIPGKYNYAATTGKQFLRVDVVDATNTPVTMSPLTVILDQLGVGLTPGAFDYATEDLQFVGNTVITNPDPATGGSGGGGGGDDGGRGRDPFGGGGFFGL